MTVFTTASHLSLFRTILVQPTPPYVSQIHEHTIFPLEANVLQHASLREVSPTKILYAFLFSSIHATYAANLILLPSVAVTVSGEEGRS